MPAPGQQQQSSSPVQCGESPELGAPASEAAAAACGVVERERKPDHDQSPRNKFAPPPAVVFDSKLGGV